MKGRPHMKCRTYRQDKEIKSAGAVEKIVAEEVPEGHVLEVTHMSIVDETTPDLLLELGYVDQADEDRILTANDGTTRYECHLTGHAWIEGGEKPFGRVTTAELNDVVVFSCHGKLWKKE